MAHLVINHWNVNKQWNNDIKRNDMLKIMGGAHILCIQEPFNNGYGDIGNIKIPVINGYNVIYNKYKLNKNKNIVYAKTLIYIKDYLHFNPLYINKINHSNPKSNIFYTIIQIYTNNDNNCNNNNNTIYLINIYRSPSSQNKLTLNQFTNLINSIKNKKNIIITGDINIWHECIGSPDKRNIYKQKFINGDNYINILTKIGCKIINDNTNYNTFIHNGNKMKVDDVTATTYNISNLCKWYTDESIDCSDHFRIIIDIKLSVKKEISYYKIWNINSKTNWNKYYNQISIEFIKFLNSKKNEYKELMNRINNNNNNNYNDNHNNNNDNNNNNINNEQLLNQFINNYFIQITNKIQMFAEEYIGSTTYSTNDNKWYNKECKLINNKFMNIKNQSSNILKKIIKYKKKHKLFSMSILQIKNKMNLNKYQNNLINIYLNIRKLRNHIINKTKYQYYNKQMRKLINNNKDKKWYELIQKLKKINHKFNKTVRVKKNNNNQWTTNNYETAQVFNNYYNNIPLNKNNKLLNGNNINEKINNYELQHKRIINNQNNEHDIEKKNYFKEITLNELKYHFNKIKNNLSLGYDSIHKEFINNNTILKTILFGYNIIIKHQIFPKHLNLRIITPTPKPNKDNNIIKNNRPVSNDKLLQKLILSIITHRTFQYLIKLKLILSNNYGGIGTKSTEDLLLYKTEKITNDNNNNIQTYSSNFDSSSAFDRVHIKLLLKRLQYHFGFNDNMIKLINSIFINRYSICKINKVYSNITEINTGLIQGQSLSTLLYCTYIHPMLYTLKLKYPNIITNAFVDDIDNYTTYTNNKYITNNDKNRQNIINNLKKQFNESSNYIYKYLTINNVIVNEAKTKFIVYYSKFIKSELLLNNKIINNVKHVKLVGIWFSYDLSFNYHINKLIYKLNTAKLEYYSITHANKYLNSNAKLFYFKIIAHSIINYCSTIYANDFNDKTLNKLISKINNSINLIIKNNTIPIIQKNMYLDIKDIKMNFLKLKCNLFSKLLRANSSINNQLKEAFLSNIYYFNLNYYNDKNNIYLNYYNNINNNNNKNNKIKLSPLIYCYHAFQLFNNTDYLAIDNPNNYFQFTELQPILYNYDLPNNITCIKTNCNNNIELNNNKTLYIFTDASVAIDCGNIPIGRAAASINMYYKKKLIIEDSLIINYKSNSNTAELQVINIALNKIINNIHLLKNIDNINIYTDSINAIEIIQSINVNKNEIYQKFKKQIYIKSEIIKKSITIIKCKSKKNHYNNIVDRNSKKYINRININHLNISNISYEQIKKENTYIYNNLILEKWYHYLNTTIFSKHLKENKVEIEKYHIQDLLYMNSTETSILISIFSGHIKLNYYLYHKLKTISNPYCTYCNNIEETLTHYLFQCKNNIQLINNRNKQINDILKNNNLNNYKINYKLICYSNKNIPQTIRVKIKKIVIKYVILTQRFNDYKDI